MKNKRVLISGAGIAGLTVAYWLKRYGFMPTLVERHAELHTGGYKVDIRGVAVDIIKRMGLYSRIYDARTDIQKATFVNSTGGEITEMSGNLSGVRNENDFEIMRGDLCQILMEQVKDVRFLFGDSITKIDQGNEGVRVEFERNAPETFDIVVGADGLHSSVRRLVFGDESQFLQKLGIFLSVYTIPNFLKLDRRELEYYEPNRYVNVYSTRGDHNAKSCFAFSSPSLPFDFRDVAKQKELLFNAFKDLKWEVPRLLSEMKCSPDFYFDCAAQTHMERWSRGRIVLVGDAGYAVSPLSGQGTSVAIAGAYVLAGELAVAQGNHEKAFSNYEKAMRNFVRLNQKTVRVSAQVLAAPNSSFTAWISQLFMRLMPESAVLFLKKLCLRRITKASYALSLHSYQHQKEVDK